jgi:hypothetical protein
VVVIKGLGPRTSLLCSVSEAARRVNSTDARPSRLHSGTCHGAVSEVL